MPCVSPLGYISKKMSVKETLMRKGVKADSRLDFEELFFGSEFLNKIPGKPFLKTPIIQISIDPPNLITFGETCGNVLQILSLKTGIFL